MSYTNDGSALASANSRSYRIANFNGVNDGTKFGESYPIQVPGANYLNSLTVSCQSPCLDTEMAIIRAYRYRWYYDGSVWKYIWDAPLIQEVKFESSYVYNWNYDVTSSITGNNQPLWAYHVDGDTVEADFLVLAVQYFTTSPGKTRLQDLLVTAFVGNTPGKIPRTFSGPPIPPPTNDGNQHFP